ncbi:hypothetical protein [Profundibacter sp.]
MASTSWRSGYAADCKSKTKPCNINENPQICYQDKPKTDCEPDKRRVSKKENAVSDATDHGVISIVARKNQHRNHTPIRGRSAMSKYGKIPHKRVAKTLGYALTLGGEASWHGFTIVLLARLTEPERAALALAALNSLDHNNAYTVGKTNGLPESTRRLILDRCFSGQLPPIESLSALRLWGEPKTALRLRKIAYHIAGLTKNFKKMPSGGYETAISGWEGRGSRSDTLSARS